MSFITHYRYKVADLPLGRLTLSVAIAYYICYTLFRSCCFTSLFVFPLGGTMGQAPTLISPRKKKNF